MFLHLQSINKSRGLFQNLPKYLFYFLSCFSIISYFFNLNLGTDAYNYWNIGLNENEWGFTPGRVNGFQAGGPNSFGDLICVLGIYTLANVKEYLKPLIILLSFVSCFFTYSRSSLIVLVFFIVVYLVQKSDLKNLGVLILAILLTLNFGLIERFSSEKETEGIQDRIEMQTATAEYLTNQNFTSLFFGSGLNNIGIVDDTVGSVESFNENLRVTGPHNSYLFFILKYGILGLVLYLSIFNKFISKILNINLKKLSTNGSFLSISAFLTLGLSSDLLHNHTVVWLIFYFLYDLNE
jgi:O-antigen ligase